MKLSIFVVSYFDRVLWSNMTLRVIAETEAQVADIADKMCSAEYRGYSSGDSVVDDLRITKEQDITFPYVLTISEE